MKGRKPLPVAIKDFRGRPGHRPINREAPEPLLVDQAITPPRWLKGEAKREWYRQIGSLTSNRVLGENEISLLASYCYLQGQFIEEVKAKRTMTAALITQMRGLAAEFGIGPSSRSRIKKGNEQKDPEEQRFFG